MKKLSTFGLLILVASMIVGGIPMYAEAQSDATALLRLASSAQKQVERQLASVDEHSPEIKRLYAEGISEVNALEKAIRTDDSSSIRNHFLKAMNAFKKITQMISDRPKAEAMTVEVSPRYNYDSDLKRLIKLISTLKSISKNQVDFEQVDRLVEQAKKQIRANEYADLKDTLQQLKNLLGDIQKELRKHATQTTVNREIKFFTTMIDRLEGKEGVDEDSLNEAKQMLSELEQLISDENFDEAKKLKRELTNKIREIYKSL